MQLINDTQFASERFVDSDKDGSEILVLTVKATYDISPPGNLTLADEQLKIEWADIYSGEPGTSSLSYEADITWAKLATDIVLIGNAYPKRLGDRTVDVSLRVGNLWTVVRVFGDRYWNNFVGITRKSAPKPFEKIPMVYERAFGGADFSSPNPKHHEYEQRNPVGLGFRAKHSKLPIDGTKLPNIEDPKKLISKPSDRPVPMCFGFVAKNWMPRRQFAGTYDQKWIKNKMPLPPDDFNGKFNSAASLGLISDGFLKGDEAVEILNASPNNILRFKIPKVLVKGSVLIDAKLDYFEMRLDTVIINTDSLKLILVWHGSYNVYKKLDDIRCVRAEIGAPGNAKK